MDWVLGQFGRQRSRAQKVYRQFVREGLKAASPWESLHGQIWLGGEAFRARMAPLIAERGLHAVPQAQLRPERPAPMALFDAVG